MNRKYNQKCNKYKINFKNYKKKIIYQLKKTIYKKTNKKTKNLNKMKRVIFIQKHKIKCYLKFNKQKILIPFFKKKNKQLQIKSM